ncbi:hypothetical protein HDU98_007486 [Podochytrium sp. JEL0797]|nr:hypothetical protein HDU98_007486 [Podochytrium sp. JEL0797]
MDNNEQRQDEHTEQHNIRAQNPFRHLPPPLQPPQHYAHPHMMHHPQQLTPSPTMDFELNFYPSSFAAPPMMLPMDFFNKQVSSAAPAFDFAPPAEHRVHAEDDSPPVPAPATTKRASRPSPKTTKRKSPKQSTRFRATDQEQAFLYAQFEKNPFPSAEERQTIADTLGMETRQVQFCVEKAAEPDHVDQSNDALVDDDPARRDGLKTAKHGRFFFLTLVLGSLVVLSVTLGIYFSKQAHAVLPPTVPPLNLTYTPDPRLKKVLYGLDYTPPFCGQYNTGCCLTQQDVLEHVKLMSQVTTRIRIYGMDCLLGDFTLNAIRLLGVDMQVALTVWVSNDITVVDRQTKELIRVVEKYNFANISAISVGNELLLGAGDQGSEAQVYLNSQLDNVRATILKIANNGSTPLNHTIPKIVSTDVASSWGEYPQLIEHSDEAWGNVHPFFAGVTPQNGTDFASKSFYDPSNGLYSIAAKFNKTGVISETGWPTAPANMSYEAAVPTVENMVIYMKDFVCMAETKNIVYYWFEAFDCPWKGVYSLREASWGMWNYDLTLKEGMEFPDCGSSHASEKSFDHKVPAAVKANIALDAAVIPQPSSSAASSVSVVTSVSAASSASTALPKPAPPSSSSLLSPNFPSLLNSSLQFFETTRSGKLSPAVLSDFPFMASSCWNDGSDVHMDYSGGLYDTAASIVKFTLPFAWTTTISSWGLLSYSEGYGASHSFALESLRWNLDYLLKLTSPINGTTALAVQVGTEGSGNNVAWGQPSQLCTYALRMSFVATEEHPASDAAAEVSAALAAGSLVFAETNTSYSSILLQNAQDMFQFANDFHGLASDHVPPELGGLYYGSVSARDDLAWGACWLYKATHGAGTIKNGTNYLDLCRSYQQIAVDFKDSYYSRTPDYKFDWDWKDRGVDVLMATTLPDAFVASSANSLFGNRTIGMFANFTFPGDEFVFYTKGGLFSRDLALTRNFDFAIAPNAMSMTFLSYVFSDFVAANPSLAAANPQLTTLAAAASGFGTMQLEYILGDNPNSVVFITGVANNSVQQPTSFLAQSGTISINEPALNKYTLPGALVGGPNITDGYEDDRTKRLFNEPILYMNAPMPGIFARQSLKKQSVGGVMNFMNSQVEGLRGSLMASSEDPALAANVRRAAAEGHHIGAHTYYHQDITLMSDAELFAEFSMAEVAIAGATGTSPVLFRPPYGNYNKRTMAVAEAFGYTSLLWSFDSRDSLQIYDLTADVGALFSRLELFANKTSDPGLIILEHDIAIVNAEIFAALVSQIAEVGFRIVDMTECLGMSLARPKDAPSIALSSYMVETVHNNNTMSGLPFNLPQSIFGLIIIVFAYVQIIFCGFLIIYSLHQIYKHSERRIKPQATRVIGVLVVMAIGIAQVFTLLVFFKPVVDIIEYRMDPGSTWVNAGDSSYPSAAELVQSAQNATSLTNLGAIMSFQNVRHGQSLLSSIGIYGFAGISVFNMILVSVQVCVGLYYAHKNRLLPWSSTRSKPDKKRKTAFKYNTLFGNTKRVQSKKPAPHAAAIESLLPPPTALVQVVLPTYNERPDVMYNTIMSLIELDYPKHLLHLIVAFDDEKETEAYETLSGMLTRAAGPYPPVFVTKFQGIAVTVGRFLHGGKRHAQGYGVRVAANYAEQFSERHPNKTFSSSYILFMDSDMRVYKDAVGVMVQAMVDRKSDALTGLTTVRTKGANLLEVIQATEYVRIQLMEKALHDLLGTTGCLSGCLTICKFEALLKVSHLYFKDVPGYSKPEIAHMKAQLGNTDEPAQDLSLSDEFTPNGEVEEINDPSPFANWRMTLGEDRWLTHLLHQYGNPRKGAVGFCAEAKASTEVPKSFFVLLAQRRRWMLGMLANEMHFLSTGWTWKTTPIVCAHRLILVAGFSGGIIDLLVIMNLLFWGTTTLTYINIGVLFGGTWILVTLVAIGTDQTDVAIWFPVSYILQPLLNACYNFYALFTFQQKGWGGPRAAAEKERQLKSAQSDEMVWMARINCESVDEEFIRPVWSIHAYRVVNVIRLFVLLAYVYQRILLIRDGSSTVEIVLQSLVLFIECMTHLAYSVTAFAGFPIPKPVLGPVIGNDHVTDDSEEIAAIAAETAETFINQPVVYRREKSRGYTVDMSHQNLRKRANHRRTSSPAPQSARSPKPMTVTSALQASDADELTESSVGTALTNVSSVSGPAPRIPSPTSPSSLVANGAFLRSNSVQSLQSIEVVPRPWMASEPPTARPISSAGSESSSMSPLAMTHPSPLSPSRARSSNIPRSWSALSFDSIYQRGGGGANGLATTPGYPHDESTLSYDASSFVSMDEYDASVLIQPDEAVMEALELVTVDVFITTYKEPVETIRNTVEAALSMYKPPRVTSVNVYLLDDKSTVEKALLCNEFGITHLTRDNNNHAKAGNINHALTKTHGDLVLQLDCDMIPEPEMLKVLVDYIMLDSRCGWVQSPQRYRDVIPGDPFCVRSQIFYDRMLPSLDAVGAVPCVGTNFIIRRAALQSIGGMPTESVCEDYMMALDLFRKGWKSRYLRRNLAYGTTPQSATEARTQQTRWQVGGLQVIYARFGLGGMKGWRGMTYLLTFLNYAVNPLLRVSATLFLLAYLWTDLNLFSNRIPLLGLMLYPISLFSSILFIQTPRRELTWNLWCDLQRGGYLLARLLDAYIVHGFTFNAEKRKTFQATINTSKSEAIPNAEGSAFLESATVAAPKKKAAPSHLMAALKATWFHMIVAAGFLGGVGFAAWRSSKQHGFVPIPVDPYALVPPEAQIPPRPLALDVIIMAFAVQEASVLLFYIVRTFRPVPETVEDDKSYWSSTAVVNSVDVIIGTGITLAMILGGVVTLFLQPGVVFSSFS